MDTFYLSPAKRLWSGAAAAFLALCLLGSSEAQAASAQVSVSAFASDLPSGVQFAKNVDGSPATGFAVASRTVTTIAGNSTSHAEAQSNALSGTIKGKVSAAVVADHFVPGRNAGANGVAAMDGTINLVGSALLPGPATFTAVLEGSYSVVTPAPFNFPSIDNRVEMAYHFSVGDSPEFHDNLLFSCCSPGTFSIPFTWTQLVHAGDSIAFNLFLNASAFTVAGSSEFDASNTFKITGVELPPGFTFTSDAQGFLAQFPSPAPIPIPATMWFFGSAMGAVAGAFRRHRSIGEIGAGVSII